ncbi:MAG: hypothetical protein QME60_05285 [Verrucomicrobiota bacterium]|nr:hypothetical protein [Verrucomicrobiota bacterium]
MLQLRLELRPTVLMFAVECKRKGHARGTDPMTTCRLDLNLMLVVLFGVSLSAMGCPYPSGAKVVPEVICARGTAQLLLSVERGDEDYKITSGGVQVDCVIRGGGQEIRPPPVFPPITGPGEDQYVTDLPTLGPGRYEVTVSAGVTSSPGGSPVTKSATFPPLPLTVPKVDTETVATTPSNRSRTKIGIGEEVVCSVLPAMSVNWSATGGGTVSPSTGNSTTFTASKSPSTSIVHAQVAGADCTVTFTVVAPDGMTTSLASDGSLGSPGTNNIGAKSFSDCYVLPNDVSFYKVEFQENIPGESYTWPDGTGGTRPSAIVPWGVGFDNKTTDTVSSGLDPAARIFNGTNYVDFTYGVRVPEEYKNEGGTWVRWLPGENHPRDYRGSDRKARTKLEASDTAIGGWMGPWQ